MNIVKFCQMQTKGEKNVVAAGYLKAAYWPRYGMGSCQFWQEFCF